MIRKIILGNIALGILVCGCLTPSWNHHYKKCLNICEEYTDPNSRVACKERCLRIKLLERRNYFKDPQKQLMNNRSLDHKIN